MTEFLGLLTPPQDESWMGYCAQLVHGKSGCTNFSVILCWLSIQTLGSLTSLIHYSRQGISMFSLVFPNQKGLPLVCQEGTQKNEFEELKTFLFIYKIFLCWHAYRLPYFILILFSHRLPPSSWFPFTPN